jgi:AAA family ATP:ADP antiporter
MADERAKRETIERNIRKIRRIQEEKKIEIEIKFSSNNRPKPKPTLMESMKELFKSRELRAMGTMVLCYNVCIELSEVLWKGLLRKQFNTQSDYMSYMATFSQYVGVVALLLQLFASTIIRELGWKGSAMITPISMLLLAIPFFLSVYLGPERGVSLGTALSIGTLQNIASKVTKYSLFDPCKEMAYIPLGPEAKVKGKAAVDVLGARLGRSIGSASQQLMVFLIGQGSILPCAPALGTLYVVAILFWTNAVSVLNELFVEKEDKLGEVIRSVIAATEAVQKKQAEIAEKKKAKE